MASRSRSRRERSPASNQRLRVGEAVHLARARTRRRSTPTHVAVAAVAEGQRAGPSRGRRSPRARRAGSARRRGCSRPAPPRRLPRGSSPPISMAWRAELDRLAVVAIEHPEVGIGVEGLGLLRTRRAACSAMSSAGLRRSLRVGVAAAPKRGPCARSASTAASALPVAERAARCRRPRRTPRGRRRAGDDHVLARRTSSRSAATLRVRSPAARRFARASWRRGLAMGAGGAAVSSGRGRVAQHGVAIAGRVRVVGEERRRPVLVRTRLQGREDASVQRRSWSPGRSRRGRPRAPPRAGTRSRRPSTWRRPLARTLLRLRRRAPPGRAGPGRRPAR